MVVRVDVLVLRGLGVADQLGEHAGVAAADPVGRLLRVVGVGRHHPDELAVAAERDRLDAVLGLAALARPQRAAEADEVLGDLDVEQLAGDQVPGLVQRDRRPSARTTNSTTPTR